MIYRPTVSELLLLLLLYFSTLCSSTQNYYYDKGSVDTLSQCPGKYCGRTLMSNGSWSPCGACERGLRRNTTSACEICSDDPTFYDWFYLGFMVLLPLIYHLVCIDNSAKRRKFTKEVIILYGIAFVEIVLAAIFSLLIFEPRGSLYIRSCHVRDLADWYPILHNPNPNYEGQLYCTQEAVYPLYSIIFVFYTLCLVIMLLVRSWLSSKLLPGRGKMSIYSAMYFFPVLILSHAVLGGLVYYSFPYIVIVSSIISNAAYFAYQLDQSMKSLFMGTLKNGRSLVILFGHWFLHAYGIVAATEIQYPLLLLLIPLPSLFYILTSKFSDPSHFM
ncbi:UNVERIFIED_CONTAM: hypothetical protein RMT77_005666 [Armadillidium vulgare]